MDLKEIQKLAEAQRNVAKTKLNQLLKIPEGFSSELADSFVDDLVTCVILEITALQKESIDKLG